jgi:hypothetical protein
MAARFGYLTTRQDNRQARTACATALLRWVHVVIARQVAWPGHRRRVRVGPAGRMNVTSAL